MQGRVHPLPGRVGASETSSAETEKAEKDENVMKKPAAKGSRKKAGDEMDSEHSPLGGRHDSDNNDPEGSHGEESSGFGESGIPHDMQTNKRPAASETVKKRPAKSRKKEKPYGKLWEWW